MLRGRASRAVGTALTWAVAASAAGLAVIATATPAQAAGFGAGNLVVVRVGTGAASLSSAANPMFLDEYTPAGTLVQSVPLPTTTSGANRAITNSGTATSNGALTRSTDGRFLTLAGYNAAVGTASVTGSSATSVNRVVAKVGADASVDTTTALSDAYSGDNFRAAVTDDGSRFWLAGTGSGSSAGVRFAALGATTSTQITSTPSNTRTVGIGDGQLYVGSGSSPFVGVSAVGSGLPTSAATATLTLADPTLTSPYGFVLLDRSASVPGVDTAYVADDSASSSSGLQKFSFDGSTWTRRGNLAGGLRGLTGSISSDGSVVLFGTPTSSASIVRIIDTAAFDATITATSSPLVTAAANTALRGIAFAPEAGAAAPSITTQPQSTTIASGDTATLSVTAAGTAPLSYQWYEGQTGDTGTPVGADAATFTTPALSATTSYWVRVSNASGSVDSDTATVTVQVVPPTNTPPTITPESVQPIAATVGDPTGPPAQRTVTVADAESAAGSLTVAAVSSDPTVATASVTGTGTERTVEITPVGAGYATLTLEVDDGELTDTASLRVGVGAALPSGTINHYGISDASAAVDLGGDRFVLADDETNVLRTYARTDSRYPSAQLDLRAAGLVLPDANTTREIDIEAAARTGDTVFWVASQGQNSSGNTRLNRRMLFTTEVAADGSLSVGGSYQNLRNDLVAWDDANGGTYGIAAAAARAPESTPSGLNLEGVEFAPDGDTLLLAFRGPLTSDGKALIVPLTNPQALVTANPTTGVTATFGTPIELDLGGRGIRDLRRNAAGDYLIAAGPSGAATGAAGEFRLYSWDGAGSAAFGRAADLDGLAQAGSVETIVSVPSPLTATSLVQLVTDSGDTVWYGDGTITKELQDRELMKSVSRSVAVGAAPACTTPVTRVGDVQGPGPSAAITGPVTVRGTVVGDYEGASPTLRGFYLQDSGDGSAATSDGIFVFNGNTDSVATGQVVEVTGTAGEFQDQTQISNATVTPCGTTATVTPVDVTLPVASATALERYEGMLVRMNQELSVTESFQLGRFGQVVVSSGGRLQQPTSLYAADDPRSAALQAANTLNRLIVDDALNAQNPDPIVFGRGGQPLSAANTLRIGDTVTDPVGVMTYTWAGNSASGNAYRLRPVGALGGDVQFTAANARPTTAPAVGGSVKVASANLLNYFNTFTGCTFGVGGAAADCRGAENQTEFDRQAPKEVAALTALGADVIGVNEIENDGYGAASAIADLTDRLNAAGGPWAFVDADAGTGRTNALGTDAIKVGMLYRSDRVQPVSGTTLADENITAYDRVPLSQTFEPLGSAGKFTVVVNHFKSKSCTGATGAELDQGDGQGCYNARRTAQATALVDFITDTVVPAASDPDVLVTGDINAYAKEDPIAVLEAAGYVNLLEQFLGEDAYTYVFDGQTGYLDHALVSASLQPQVNGADAFHINADEPSVLDYNTNFKSPGQVSSLYAPDVYRSSDHDSVLVGLTPDFDATTTTTVTSSKPATLYKEAVTFTATVVPTTPGLTPTGTVQFTAGTLALGAPVAVAADGTAVTPPITTLRANQSRITAAYSGDSVLEASSGITTQRVTFGFPAFTSPAANGAYRAGSTVPLRFGLTDVNGVAIEDNLGFTLVRPTACQIKVQVTGVQTLAPTCVKYNAAANEFRFDWKTRATPRGTVRMTVTITFPFGPPQTRSVTLRLQP